MVRAALQEIINEMKFLNQSPDISSPKNFARYGELTSLLVSPKYVHEVYELLHPPDRPPTRGITLGVLD